MMEEGLDELYDVIIIGAGASGLMSTCLLACNEGGANSVTSDGFGSPDSAPRVLLLEKWDRVGRKLSATGNGRCNLTNMEMSWKNYYGDRDGIEGVLEKVPPTSVIKQFEKLGVLTREKDGYVYPHSNQAATVVGALYRGIRKKNITLKLGCNVSNIEHDSEKVFAVETDQGTYLGRHLLLAAGGPAGKEQGGSDDGYSFLRRLGHTVTNIYPGLTGMDAAGRWWKDVAGTRVQGAFTLFVDGVKQGTERGEIQITKTGVSGIPVFQMCRLAAEGLDEGKPVWGEIDFVPTMDMESLVSWIDEHGIEGLVPTKWISVIASGQKDTKLIAKTLKRFEFTITDTYGIEKAQVSAGGVPVDEIDMNTFESKKVPGMYVLGELVDIDGMCGGYNLHLAWASAMIASKSILSKGLQV